MNWKEASQAVLVAPFVAWGLFTAWRILQAGRFGYPSMPITRRGQPIRFWAFCALLIVSFLLAGLMAIDLMRRAFSS